MRFREFRGAHDGETMIVCGCGQSLHSLPDPGRHVTIGVNDVGRLFDPTYLVVVNSRSQFKAERFRYIEHSNARYLFSQLDLGAVRPSVVRFRLGQFGGTDIGATDVLHYTQNSPYVAVCLAVYMGACRIGLIGVDLTDGHFFAHTGRHSLSSRVREIDAQYARLAAVLARRGVELVNLSPISRICSLPSARLEAAGSSWTQIAAVTPTRNAMKIVVEKRSHGAVAQLLDALAASAGRLGHSVVRGRPTSADPRVLTVVWNGRGLLGQGPTLYCEHGWLPRSDYQISHKGVNAGSHVAPFAWNGLALLGDEDAALERHLQAVKSATHLGHYQYMEASKPAAEGLPANFLLVALQIESDTNIVRHAPPHLRTMQALVDHVARVNPPWPVVFKQHPTDARRGNRHLQLHLRRPHDKIWPHARGNVHQLLKSGACRGIVTVNSNVAHDGLLWDIPAVVLGRNVWPPAGARTPFLTEFPHDWSVLEESVRSAQGISCRRAYAHYLMTHQWTLADADDPAKVAALIAQAVPHARHSRPAPRLVSGTRTRKPCINVVAANRGWLFEAWKQRFVSEGHPRFEIVATEKPLRDAAAWIFVRAREAAAVRDPVRSVVQVHDLEFERSWLRCAGLSFTHPGQRKLLEAAGADLSSHRVIVQPVGWGGGEPGQGATRASGTLAWIGRPMHGNGAEGLGGFVEAMRLLRVRPPVTLIGERLDRAGAALARIGVKVRVLDTRACPLWAPGRWISGFAAVVAGTSGDSGPWPIFDSLHAGTPVIAAPRGWAETLLADGICGRLASNPEGLARALEEVMDARRTSWESRDVLRARVADYSQYAWIRSNLELAAGLAAEHFRQAA